jgi:hypothetical protein
LKTVPRNKPAVLVICLAALLLAGIACMAVFRWDLLFAGRAAYLESSAYETQTRRADSPQAVAADLAAGCTGAPGRCQLVALTFVRIAPDRAITVLQKKYLAGDSVDASRVRLELFRDGDAWSVEWAGLRWRCAPFRGNRPGWTVVPCP